MRLEIQLHLYRPDIYGPETPTISKAETESSGLALHAQCQEVRVRFRCVKQNQILFKKTRLFILFTQSTSSMQGTRLLWSRVARSMSQPINRGPSPKKGRLGGT